MKVESLVRSREAAKDSWAHVTLKRGAGGGRAKAAKTESTSLRSAS